MVAVQVTDIGSMMHSVMRRRIENEFDDPWELVERFGVQPVLIDQTHTQHGNDHRRVEAQECQRHPERVFEHALTDALSQGGTEVVVL